MGTDSDWEKWGADNPYYGVLSSPEYLNENLSEEGREKFFRSGEVFIGRILEKLQQHVRPGFAPTQALDFGCGVGRLVAALARHAGHVTGIDVSDSMLAEARANCQRLGLGNTHFLRSDDTLSKLTGEFDLIHSHIVFQHIPTAKGMVLLSRLLEHLAPGGVVALQFYHACEANPLVRLLVQLRYRIPPLNVVRNLLRGRPWNEPAMQLHVYPLPDVLKALQQAGIEAPYLEYSRHAEFVSVTIFGEKR